MDMYICTCNTPDHASLRAVEELVALVGLREATTPNLSNIVGFRGFDSSTISISRDGIPMSIGELPESLSQAMLVGIMLVGRLGVY